MPSPSSNITVIHDSQEWSTDLTGDISEIKVDGKSIPISSKKTFIAGICLGVLASLSVISTSIYTWVSLKNIGMYEKDSHQIVSREGVMMLEQQGIGWNEEKRMWVNKSVTNLSPRLLSADR